MSKPKTPRPTCQYCGRQLPKRTYHYDLKDGEPDPATIYDKPVVSVLRRRPRPGYAEGQLRSMLSLWAGEYGRYGDGYFCGLTCGWRFALQVMRELEKRKQGGER
jgi:hypothetical protein